MDGLERPVCARTFQVWPTIETEKAQKDDQQWPTITAFKNRKKKMSVECLQLAQVKSPRAHFSTVPDNGPGHRMHLLSY